MIAKLDRLSRKLAFIAALQDSGAKFVAADMPEANETMIQFMAVIAQHERKMISARTKAALAAAKARGQRLGNVNGAAALRRAAKGNVAAVDAIKASADRHTANVLPVIEDIRAAGSGTLEGIARELSARGILTARGGQWYATTVRNLLARS